MEQLRQLGGRLLGKKRVAVILGLLGLCCPSSLWAEKLDTTFVLDMVIDNTLCYYTKYDNKGQISYYGIHSNSSSDFSHVNVGYVTDMTGKRVDTIYYIRDRVTKHWSVKEEFIDPYETTSFYSSGMLKSIEFDLDLNHLTHTKFSENGALMEKSHEEYVRGTEYSYSKYSEQYDQYGNITHYEYSSGSGHQGGSAWSYGSDREKKDYKNEYDERGNLVASTLTAVYTHTDGDEDRYMPDYQGTSQTTTTTITKEEHQYDAENRRVKTIRYDFEDEGFVLKDSTVYFYFTRPSISSLTINGEPLDTFSADNYDYRFDMEYKPDVVSYTLPEGVTATESFDDSTNVLTVRLVSSDTDETVEYKFHFRPTDGVDDFLGDQVNLYVTDKTICVDGATEPIYVYNLLGTLVGTGRGEEIRIPVRQTGVYVVKAGRKAAKVAVK